MKSSSNLFTVQIQAPPPPVSVSPEGTKIPPATSIVDNQNATWTQIAPVQDSAFVAGQIGIARNGVRQGNAVNFIILKGGVVYQSDTDGTFKWTGTGWTSSPIPA